MWLHYLCKVLLISVNVKCLMSSSAYFIILKQTEINGSKLPNKDSLLNFTLPETQPLGQAM